MTTDNLLILGNGFDLQCGLKSSYNDFFDSTYMKDKQELITLFMESFDEIFNANNIDFESSNIINIKLYNANFDLFKNKISLLREDKTFNFWNLVFRKPIKENSNWNDIEKIIEDVVCDSDNMSIELDEIELYYTQLMKEITMGASGHYKEFRLSGNQKHNFIFALYLCIATPEIIDMHLYLLKELKKFEHSFFWYLEEEVARNEAYSHKVKLLLEKLYKSNSNIKQTNVINFNYTTIAKFPKVVIESNVHGSLLKGNIIFGIDLSDLEDKKGSLFFSKTYRKMHAFENINIEEFEKKRVLDREIKSITFYGHSLNKSDYSYFQSVFDFYEIYNSEVSLVFYYSVYEKKMSSEIIENYTNSVINLLNTYGKTMANGFHGKNFMHKLLLENRVILKEI